ncbi:helix-turn-helix domain-containing protein [Myxococcus landrumensis]|nr:helix-turn-helix transcriptional regulator [Myxococcus landrumus]
MEFDRPLDGSTEASRARARDERIAKAIRQGVPIDALRERFDCEEPSIRRVAWERGLVIGVVVAEGIGVHAPAGNADTGPAAVVRLPRGSTTSPGQGRMYDMSCSAVLVGARQEAGLAQSDVARHLGTSITRVSAYERGRKLPTHARALQMAALYGVDPAVVLSQWARWRGEVPLYRTAELRRDFIAAALSAQWESLSAETLERIAQAVGV